MSDHQGYDKGVTLAGVGHHTPSYATGYEIGREDTRQALLPGLVERDKALYAAYLLLGEAQGGVEPQLTRRWTQAVARWRAEYRDVLEAVKE